MPHSIVSLTIGHLTAGRGRPSSVPLSHRRASWQYSAHSPYVTGRHPGKVVFKTQTIMRQCGKGGGHRKHKTSSLQAHAEMWVVEMDEAMINKVTQPERWQSLSSQSFGTYSCLPSSWRPQQDTCQGNRMISAVPPFPREVIKESQQSFLT